MCDNSGVSTDDLVRAEPGTRLLSRSNPDAARTAADPLGLFNKPPGPPDAPDRPEPRDTNAFMRARQRQRDQERSRQGRQSTILTSSGGRSGPLGNDTILGG